jgi:hypothetical protein
MPRKKNPNNNYFHEGVEEAIQLYNIAETEREKNTLFAIIYPALFKIAEVYYNKIKPIYMEGEPIDIQYDCVGYLTERLYRIQRGKGKAFSYMTICAKNYYIFHNDRGYKGTKKTLKLDVLNENWDIEDVDTGRAQQMEDSAKLLNAFADYLETNLKSFHTVHTRKAAPVVQAVVDLIRNIDNIEDFNRRTIMNNLCNINGLKIDRHYITKMFNKFEVHYINFKREWDKGKLASNFEMKEELTQEEIDYCIKHYKIQDREVGVKALSKKFGVESYEVRKQLGKAGLITM